VWCSRRPRSQMARVTKACFVLPISTLPAGCSRRRGDGGGRSTPYKKKLVQAIRLEEAASPRAPTVPGGLYGDPDAQRARERRRKANEALQQAGLRPRGW
jgi:hypothetical protein